MRVWYTEFNGKPKGPFTAEVIAAQFNDGDIDANTRVWCHGMKSWVTLGETSFVSGEFDEIPPLVPTLEDAEPPAIADVGEILDEPNDEEVGFLSNSALEAQSKGDAPVHNPSAFLSPTEWDEKLTEQDLARQFSNIEVNYRALFALVIAIFHPLVILFGALGWSISFGLILQIALTLFLAIAACGHSDEIKQRARANGLLGVPTGRSFAILAIMIAAASPVCIGLFKGLNEIRGLF